MSQFIGISRGDGKDREILLKKALNTIGRDCNVGCIEDMDDLLYPESSIHHGKGLLIGEASIYNFKELKKKYSLHAITHEELLLELIELHGHENLGRYLSEIEGEFAFAYIIGHTIVMARDLIGLCPLYYSEDGSFATEKKMLIEAGFSGIKEVDPRDIIMIDTETGHETSIPRDFFVILPEINDDEKTIVDELAKKIEKAMEIRFPDERFGIMFSGGIDSTFIAFIAKRLKKDFVCYTAGLVEEGMDTPQDFIWADRVAADLDLELIKIEKEVSETEAYIKKIIPVIESDNVVKIGVALPEYLCCERAKKDGIKYLFSGLGTEEIFAGYERFRKTPNINMECIAGLLSMHERDTYRDYTVAKANDVSMRVPFMDSVLMEYSLKIPAHFKINEDQSKIILRKAAEYLGLNREFSWRKKKAAQYGSKFDKALQVLAKKNGFQKKSDYLKSLSDND